MTIVLFYQLISVYFEGNNLMKRNRRYLFMATVALTALALTGTTSIKAHADDNQTVIITQQQMASVGSQKILALILLLQMIHNRALTYQVLLILMGTLAR